MIISGDDPVSKGAQRFEVFTGAGRRKDWPPEVQALIVAECWPGGEKVSAVARRHALDPSQIYGWRKELARQFKEQGPLDPGRGRTKTGQLWAYTRDDRPKGGIDPPMMAYVYAADRKSERAEAHLGDFASILQVDGYGGYTALLPARLEPPTAEG